MARASAVVGSEIADAIPDTDAHGPVVLDFKTDEDEDKEELGDAVEDLDTNAVALAALSTLKGNDLSALD
jgi:hypothetical protein